MSVRRSAARVDGTATAVAVPFDFVSVTLCFQGPYYWVLKGSRALIIRSLEAQGQAWQLSVQVLVPTSELQAQQRSGTAPPLSADRRPIAVRESSIHQDIL